LHIHWYIAQQIARQREHELRRSARRYGQLEPNRKPRGAVRYRTGWVFIEIGLAIICGSGDVSGD